MAPDTFKPGSKVVLLFDNVFRNDVFTVVGHREDSVLVTVLNFGQVVELELDPQLLRTAHDSTAATVLGQNKYEQMCALLRGAADTQQINISTVLTVSREEVQDFVKIYGLPNEIKFSRPPSSKDGLFFYELNGEWTVCFREQDNVHEAKTFESYELALPAVVDWLIKLSGAGLN